MLYHMVCSSPHHMVFPSPTPVTPRWSLPGLPLPSPLLTGIPSAVDSSSTPYSRRYKSPLPCHWGMLSFAMCHLMCPSDVSLKRERYHVEKSVSYLLLWSM